jgi:GT2 family glycosyltransferase
VLNPDLVLAAGALTRLVGSLDADPGVGIAVPRLLNGDGSLYHHLRDEPTILAALGDAVCGDRWPGRPRRLSEVRRRDADYESGRDVAWAGGAMWVVSAACDAAVGAWNSERYFLYSEETDYASRARDRALRVRYVPEAAAVHHGGGSGSSPELVALMTVNRVRYYEERHGRFATGLLRGVLALQHLLRLHQSESRCALGFVLRRSAWSRLPSGTTGIPVDRFPSDPARPVVAS